MINYYHIFTLQNEDAFKEVKQNTQAAIQQLLQLESISNAFLRALKQSMDDFKLLKTQYELTEVV